MRKKKHPLPAEAGEGPAAPTPEAEQESTENVLLRDTSGRHDCYTLAALLITAFCIRWYSLQFFHVISTDGTSYALNARAFAHGDFHGIAISGFYSVLIAAATLFISDLETAGRAVSLVFGSLLVIPVYLLGKSIFSKNVALAAAVTIAVWPSMVASSCEVMTQAAHTTLQLSAVYLFWRAFKAPTIRNGSLAGLAIGITYLTRPESLLLFIFMPLALLITNYRELRQQHRLIIAYCSSFLLLFLANMILVHHLTGHWQLSAKTDSALNDAISYYLERPDVNYVPGYKPMGYLDILREHPEFIWVNSLKNITIAWDTILPPALWLLFIVGYFSGGFERERNTIRLVLLATFTPAAVLIVFYYVSSGYLEAYLPIIFLFAAYGFASLAAMLKSGLSRALPPGLMCQLERIPLLLTASFAYALVTFVPQIRDNISDEEYLPETDNYRRAEKHIGLLLKKSLPPGKIMTRWARIAFYAEREWVNIPAETSLEEVIELARKSDVKFFIVDGSLYGNRPALGLELFAPLMQREQPPGEFKNLNPDYRVQGLRPYLLYTHPRSIGVVAYEIPP